MAAESVGVAPRPSVQRIGSLPLLEVDKHLGLRQEEIAEPPSKHSKTPSHSEPRDDSFFEDAEDQPSPQEPDNVPLIRQQ